MVGSQQSRYLAYRATSNTIVHRKSAFAFSCGCFAETGRQERVELGRRWKVFQRKRALLVG
jgi:hypothetical protein